MSESEMCTCIEDLYRAEIRLQLGPTVLLGVGALLVYRLWKIAAAVIQVIEDDTDDDSEDDSEADSDDDPEAEPDSEDPDAEDPYAVDAEDPDAVDADDPDDAPFDPTADDPDDAPFDPTAEDLDPDGLTATADVPNEIFPDDDTEYVSLIDAPVLGPSVLGPSVISSTEEASSDAAPPFPGIDGTPSESSPPDAV